MFGHATQPSVAQSNRMVCITTIIINTGPITSPLRSACPRAHASPMYGTIFSIPGGVFSCADQLNRGASGAKGYKSLPEEDAGGPPQPLPAKVPPGQRTSGRGHSPVPPLSGVCGIFPAQRGKKPSSPARRHHDGSTFHPSAKHCYVFAEPRAMCRMCGSHGSSPYFTAMCGDGKPMPSAKNVSCVTKIVGCVNSGMAGRSKVSRRPTD